MPAEMTDQPAPRKAPWIALLLPFALIVGLLSGMLTGAQFVPRDTGLAAGPQVLFYGMIGMLVAVVFTTILARRLTASSLRTVALVAVVLSVALIAFVALKAAEKKKQMDERSRIASHITCTPPPLRELPKHDCSKARS